MIRIILVFVVLFCGLTLHGQTLHGVVLIAGVHVHEGKETEELEPVPGAVVYWAGTTDVAVTNDKGRFQLKSIGYPALLVVSVPGLKNDTLQLETHPGKAVSYIAKPTEELKGYELKAKSGGFSFVEPRNMQMLTQSDIKKAACCNLSESFETNASVDVNYTDAVTGTKTIRMLGLDGVYSQLMFENTPFIRGLESKFGLMFLPGTWVESIQITKGAGSVTNGFESMTGQINIEFQKPDHDEREMLFVNVYLNNMLRTEVNVHYRQRLNKTWSSMLFIHAMDMSHVNDVNKDGFMDSPMNKTLSGMWRLRYETKLVEGLITAGGAYRQNMGGQNEYRHGVNDDAGHHGIDSIFGVDIITRQAYLIWKNGFLMPNRKFGTLGLIGMAKYNDMDAIIGNTVYSGIHRHLYFNSIYESIIGNTLHKYRTGLSYQMDDYREVLNDSVFARTEQIPGAHFEYTYNDDFRWQIVGGLRADWHNMYGLWIVPRLHAKYTIDSQTLIRISGGRGFRRPNAVAENMSAFASSRKFVMAGDVMPEETWNAGTSFTREFRIGKRDAVLRADYYYTWFANQMLVNMEDPRMVRIENVAGKGSAHAAQVDVSFNITKHWDVNAAYRLNLVRSEYDGEMKDMPFIPRSRAMFNTTFETKNELWRYDFTVNFFGYSRLPNTASNPVEYRLAQKSEMYATINVQITKVFRYFEVYVGGENLLNYIQPNAIIDAQNPFGSYFDASLIWGPLNGIIAYGGIRTKFRTDKNVKIKEK